MFTDIELARLIDYVIELILKMHLSSKLIHVCHKVVYKIFVLNLSTMERSTIALVTEYKAKAPKQAYPWLILAVYIVDPGTSH